MITVTVRLSCFTFYCAAWSIFAVVSHDIKWLNYQAGCGSIILPFDLMNENNGDYVPE